MLANKDNSCSSLCTAYCAYSAHNDVDVISTDEAQMAGVVSNWGHGPVAFPWSRQPATGPVVMEVFHARKGSRHQFLDACYYG